MRWLERKKRRLLGKLNRKKGCLLRWMERKKKEGKKPKGSPLDRKGEKILDEIVGKTKKKDTEENERITHDIIKKIKRMRHAVGICQP